MWKSKGQTNSKRFFQADVSSNKRTNKFNFTTMIPQDDLCLFIFWKKLKTPKRNFKINWPLVASLALFCSTALRSYDSWTNFYKSFNQWHNSVALLWAGLGCNAVWWKISRSSIILSYDRTIERKNVDGLGFSIFLPSSVCMRPPKAVKLWEATFPPLYLPYFLGVTHKMQYKTRENKGEWFGMRCYPNPFFASHVFLTLAPT